MNLGRLAGLYLVVLGFGAACGTYVAAEERISDETEINLKAGKTALEDGMYELAQKKFEQILATMRVRPSAPERMEEVASLMCRTLYQEEKYATLLAFLGRLEPWNEAMQRSGAYHFWRALALHALGLWDQALAEIEEFDKETPESGYREQMLRLRGRCEAARGQLEAAAKCFEEFSARYPNAGEAAENLLDLGLVLKKLGRNNDAAAVFEKLLARETPSVVISRGRYWYGRVLLEAGRWTQAVGILMPVATNSVVDADLRAEAWLAVADAQLALTNRMAALNSMEQAVSIAASPEMRRRAGFALGRCLVEQGEIEKGTRVLKELIAAAPNDASSENALLGLAESLLDRGEYEAALAEYQAYVETYTNQLGLARAYEGRGWCLMALGRYAEAAGSFGRAGGLATEPARREACLFKLGDARFAAGEYRAALEAYSRFLEEYPNSHLAGEAELQKAECLVRLGEVDRAGEILQAIAGTCSNTVVWGEALVRLARLDEAAGRWQAALAAYERVLAGPTNNAAYPAALRGRGVLRLRLFRFTEALDDFVRLAREFPGNEMAEEARYRQASCYYAMGRDAEAVAVWKSFVEEFPQSRWTPEAIFCLAKYQFNHGEYRVAEESFLRFADLYPEHRLAVDALFWAGTAAARQKDYSRSMEIFGRVVTRYPDSPRRAEARFAQGEALFEQARLSEAILIFDEVLATSTDNDLVARAWLRKGDAQFTLGGGDARRYRESIDSYRVVVNSVNVRPDRVLQAEYKIGRSLEKLGELNQALEQYYDRVILRYLGDRERGIIHGESSKAWVSRAAVNAAAILEARKDWRRLVALLERVIQAEVPASKMAEEQIRKVRAERWWAFGPAS